MKVKCIDEREFVSITKNKVYKVINVVNGHYIIINNLNQETAYLKSYFTVVKDVQKLRKLLKH